MICERKKCTGCFACVNICPKGCIHMEENEFGEIYPKIDEEKCIHCNLCKKTCPAINKVQRNNPISTYASFAKEHNIQENSNSGGIAALIYSYILENGGIVYGVSNIDEKNEFKFIRADEKNKLEDLKKSKYVHAKINNIFQQVKNDLVSEKYVVFIGTPCQIAGLKNYLKKDYSNLLTCDLICHGVVAKSLLQEDLKSHKIKLDDVKKIYFRKNNNYCFVIYKKDGSQIEINKEKDYFLTLFLSGELLRENCVECDYANSNRVGDITLGDFWGLKSTNKFILENYKNGMSLVLINTKKGKDFFDNIKKYVNFEERPLEEAINGNTQLIHPVGNIEGNKRFREYYKKYGYKKACRKILGIKFEIKKTTLYRVYRKVKNIGVKNKK